MAARFWWSSLFANPGPSTKGRSHGESLRKMAEYAMCHHIFGEMGWTSARNFFQHPSIFNLQQEETATKNSSNFTDHLPTRRIPKADSQPGSCWSQLLRRFWRPRVFTVGKPHLPRRNQCASTKGQVATENFGTMIWDWRHLSISVGFRIKTAIFWVYHGITNICRSIFQLENFEMVHSIRVPDVKHRCNIPLEANHLILEGADFEPLGCWRTDIFEFGWRCFWICFFYAESRVAWEPTAAFRPRDFLGWEKRWQLGCSWSHHR